MLPNPAFIIYEEKLRANLELIRSVALAAEVDIILALKAFAYWPAFPLIADYLNGATASSLNEALLIQKHLQGQLHTYAPAYHPTAVEQLAAISSHLTFNSLREMDRYAAIWDAEKIDQAPENRPLASRGLRVNPEYSPVEIALYNPASPYSRLGETLPNLPSRPPAGLEGLHVHTLCESTAGQTAELIKRVQAQFGHYLRKLRWLNLGGGHLMTKEDYQLEKLISALQGLRSSYPKLKIILEPGAAIVWQTGELHAKVLDIIDNYGRRTALLNVSFTCHMPDTLEMPYRPQVRGAHQEATDAGYAYRLGGVSCLAGDYLDAYYFDQPLLVGDTIIFEDMAHYTTVKSTMFNGVAHPAIVLLDEAGKVKASRTFGFEDYERRMG
ncbi:MAG: carboxynorspermidine decarboxylase [Bacteroidota bacterium]